eukprot:97379-Rhodomonas_salina.1
MREEAKATGGAGVVGKGCGRGKGHDAPLPSAPRHLRASANVHALLLQLNSPRAAPHLFFSILTGMSIPTKM